MKKDSTLNAYSDLYKAFNFFNKKLFNGRLPEPILSYTPMKGAYGYFAPECFKMTKTTSVINDKDLKDVHAISINPVYISKRDDKEILSTLVHEMVHLRQEIEGKPGKNGYHNKEWALLMKEVGLYPSDNGKMGGKETGNKMSHVIMKDQPFDIACDELIKSGFKFKYKMNEFKKTTKTTKKVKYVCDRSGVTVWGKPGLNIKCGDSDEYFIEVES